MQVWNPKSLFRNGMILLLALTTALSLAGCDALGSGADPETQEPTTQEPLPEAQDKVIAEAVIEPAYWAELRFPTGGKVLEVLVEEGGWSPRVICWCDLTPPTWSSRSERRR